MLMRVETFLLTCLSYENKKAEPVSLLMGSNHCWNDDVGGPSFPMIQKPAGVCLIFGYMPISIDGRNLLLDHCTANLGFNGRVSMKCEIKKTTTLLLSINATIEIRCH